MSHLIYNEHIWFRQNINPSFLLNLEHSVVLVYSCFLTPTDAAASPAVNCFVCLCWVGQAQGIRPPSKNVHNTACLYL